MMVPATGAQIADIPFVRPTKYQLIANVKGRAGGRRDQRFSRLFET
jgi:hypothetical protein